MRKHRCIRSAALMIALTALTALIPSGRARAADSADSYDAVTALLPDSIDVHNKVVYIDFWASWCMPCRHSFPWMQKLHDRYADDGLVVIAVNLDKERPAADEFLEAADVSFNVLFDAEGDLAESFALEAMPTSFLYGRDGRLVTRHQGFRESDEDDLELAVQRLLKKEKSR